MSTTNDRRTGMPVRRWRRLFSKRLLLAWGSVLAAALLVTSGLTMAAFTDAEHAKLTGIGTGTFSLKIKKDSASSGDYRDYKTASGALDVSLDAAASKLIPGGPAVATTVDVWNDGDYASTLDVEVNVDVAASQETANAFIGKLQLTVQSGGTPQELTPGTPTSLPILASNAQRPIKFSIQLSESAGNTLQGLQATITATITGTSQVA